MRKYLFALLLLISSSQFAFAVHQYATANITSANYGCFGVFVVIHTVDDDGTDYVVAHATVYIPAGCNLGVNPIKDSDLAEASGSGICNYNGEEFFYVNFRGDFSQLIKDPEVYASYLNEKRKIVFPKK